MSRAPRWTNRANASPMFGCSISRKAGSTIAKPPRSPIRSAASRTSSFASARRLPCPTTRTPHWTSSFMPPPPLPGLSVQRSSLRIFELRQESSVPHLQVPDGLQFVADLRDLLLSHHGHLKFVGPHSAAL